MNRFHSFFLTSLLIACGGSSHSTSEPTGDYAEEEATANASSTVPGAKAGPPEVAVSVGPIAVDASYASPQALFPSSLPVSRVTSRPLEEQRERYVSATGSRKVAEGEALAILLFARVADRAEAREVLRQLASGKKVSESTRSKLAVAELILGDPKASATQLDLLIAEMGQGKEAAPYRAQRAFIALLASDNAGANALIAKDLNVKSKKTPEASYIEAWLQLRKGDTKGSYKSIAAAAEDWDELGSLDKLRSELMRIGALAGVPPKEIMSALRATTRYDRANLVGLAADLTRTYAEVGRLKLAVATTELSLGASSSESLARLHLEASRVTRALGDPRSTSEHLLAAALESKRAADDLDTAVGVAIGEETKTSLALFDQIAKSAGDPNYVKAANDLRASETPSTPEFTGAHDPQAVQQLVEQRMSEVRGCYEKFLQVNPQLYGDLTITATVVPGTVKVVTSPAGGAEGLAGVASCAAKRANAWSLPVRADQGTTVITLNVKLAPTR
tara:strand:- start:22816 stop:24330 length:1515 start_codon:yes stop_codon:yes gene_type:complete